MLRHKKASWAPLARPVQFGIQDAECDCAKHAAAGISSPFSAGAAKDANLTVTFMDLIRASFVPAAPTQEMRALLRTRKQLVREQASHIQRIHKTLERCQSQTRLGADADHGRLRPRYPAGAY